MKWIGLVLVVGVGCGDGAGAGVDVDVEVGAEVGVEVGAGVDVEVGEDVDVEVGEDVGEGEGVEVGEGAEVMPLPGLAEALVFTPLEQDVSVRVQPAVAWGVGAKGVGRLAMAWTGVAGEDLGIFVGAWDVDGAGAREVTAPTLVNEERQGIRNEPALCAQADGSGFVAVWSVDTQSGDGENLQVAWRRIGSDGIALDARETVVTTDRPGNHWLAEVACRPGGGFVLAGVRAGAVGAGFSVFIQRYDSAGVAAGDALAVLDSDVGGQAFPVVAVGPGDATWVAWEDTVAADADTVIALRMLLGVDSGERREVIAKAGSDALGAVIAVHPVTGQALVGGVLDNRLRLALALDFGAPTPVALPDASGVTTSSAAVPIGVDGFALVWFKGTGTNVEVRHALMAGGTFDAATTVAKGSFPLAYRPALAVVPGFGAIAWTESLGSGKYAVRVGLYAP